MRMQAWVIGDVTLVKIHGDIVLGGSGPALAERVRTLLEQGRRHIVLDLADVRYVDSRGLAEIVEAFSATRNRGGALKLLTVTKRLNDLLTISRLNSVFDRFDNEDEAIASFAPPIAAAH